MKIRRLRTAVVDVPLPRPITTAIHDMRSVGCVLVFAESDEGPVGEGYLFTLNAVRLKSFREMVDGLAVFVEGRNPFDAEAIWQAIWADLNPSGHAGVGIAALSAIDTAIWDLAGKAAELPLARLFGACRETVPTYASGGLWLSQTPEECALEAAAFVAQGFTAVKLRIGSPDIEADVTRVRAVREAIGPSIALHVDANQGLTVTHAIRLGRRLEEFDLAWFEEPVPYHDLAGHAEIRSALDIPIATGETEWTCLGMRRILEARAADVLMPDLQRIGGLSEFRRACALAAAHETPVSTHVFTEQSLCIAGSQAACISVEHMPWGAPLFREPLELVDGALRIPDRPGTGFTFDSDAVRRFSMD